jgi:phosphate transport system ATP-binding protein
VINSSINGTCGLIQKVCVSFGATEVLTNINLEIDPNTITILVGRSGSGKTTFLRMLNRLNELFDHCCTTGQIILKIGGKSGNILGATFAVEYLRRKVGMVFQNPNVLPSSIYANIAMPLRVVTGAGKTETMIRVESALREVQLWDEVKDRLKESAMSLSGGQQQRLCLARTISLEPEILLLDEPTASLDFKASLKIEELLLKLRKTYTIIAVSHSMAQTFRIGDRIVVLKDGRISAIVNPSDFANSQSHEDLFNEIF